MQPNNSDKFIRWLFKDRCILCFKAAECIHEIEPRSSGEGSMKWENRVTLCNQCHNMGENSVHHRGNSESEIMRLKLARQKYLIRIGRKQYV